MLFFEGVVGIIWGIQIFRYGWLDLAGLLIDLSYRWKCALIAEITDLNAQCQEC
jgi:hypothetical protein